MDKEKVHQLKHSIQFHLTHTLAKDQYSATPRDKYEALAFAVRDRLAGDWMHTQRAYHDRDVRRCYYLSLEFLLGRLLKSALINLDLLEAAQEASQVLGMPLDEVCELEWDAGLGHGGLGRLAACYMDSLSTLRIPANGYGIRYEFGIFFQHIKDGAQTETPDNWLRYGNPWEFPRPEILYRVKLYGRVDSARLPDGRLRMDWLDTDEVMAMAYDIPVPGYRVPVVNTLRLWSAKATREFNLDYFNSGDYYKAMEAKSASETISKVLYPSDQSPQGKELRLKQQYFFVSATLQDILRRYLKHHRDLNALPEKAAIQLNDTHPTLAIAELMHILLDERHLEWDDAWKVVSATFHYTNHTVLPEALETWPESLLAKMLPRHLQIIQEIDRRFLVQVSRRFPDEPQRKEALRIITDGPERRVHMARLCIAASAKVNGVSALHSDLLVRRVFPDFALLLQGRFTNVTNGITPRRFLLQANPDLSALITECIGDNWVRKLDELRKLEPFAGDAAFRERFRRIKRQNKAALDDFCKKRLGFTFDPDALLDCQIKRFHEYKRQLLNVLHVITLYNRIREGRAAAETFAPRTVLFAGKSAPSYFMSKLIIKLIHSVREVVAANPGVAKLLNLVFVPNYSVSLAERILPAAELSEQISTAGFEASGTGNMKFTLNGALTIGTLDGANVEIREQVGAEHFFLFGLKADEVAAERSSYRPRTVYEANAELRQCLDQLAGGHFSPENRDLFKPIVENLLDKGDYFFVLADYAEYIRCQEEVARAYRDPSRWDASAVLNTARSGFFSSDRAIREYAERIWKAKPLD
jgi:starch phosphorylase